MRRLRFLWLLFWLACLPQAAAAAAASPVILVVGDSVSAGYGLRQDEGWVGLLAQRLAREGHDYTVVNGSVTGETTAGGLRRIDGLLETHRPRIVILELGGNDGLRGQSVDTIRSNLLAMVDAAQRRAARVVVVGMQVPPNYGAAYAEKFRRVFVDVAAERRTGLAPFLFEGFGDRREMFQPDGIHPAREAQPMMLGTVWKALGPLLEGKGRAGPAARR